MTKSIRVVIENETEIRQIQNEYYLNGEEARAYTIKID